MKQVITLTENDIQNMISESVYRILNENSAPVSRSAKRKAAGNEKSDPNLGYPAEIEKAVEKRKKDRIGNEKDKKYWSRKERAAKRRKKCNEMLGSTLIGNDWGMFDQLYKDGFRPGETIDNGIHGHSIRCYDDLGNTKDVAFPGEGAWEELNTDVDESIRRAVRKSLRNL